MNLADFYEALTGGVGWQSWRERANCRGMDPSLWFAERGQSVAEAKAVCAGCDVRDECLDFAQTYERHGGVWGGLSDRQRRSRRSKAAQERKGAA